MIIIDKAPCTISLDTHGGAVIDVGFAEIASCLGGWAFILKSDTHSHEELYVNIVSAYVAAMREFNNRCNNLIPILKKEQNGIVDQW